MSDPQLLPNKTAEKATTNIKILNKIFLYTPNQIVIKLNP